MKRLLPIICLITAVSCSAPSTTRQPEAVAGEKQATPEEVMQMMGPMMTKMMEVMMDTILTTMAKPQTAEQLATFSKNYYDALIAKGFSEDEALKIVTSVGMPSIPAMK